MTLSSTLLNCLLLSVINIEQFFNMFANSKINKNIPQLFLRFLFTWSRPFWMIWLTNLEIHTHSFRVWGAIFWAFLLKASTSLHKNRGLGGEIIFKDNGFPEQVIRQLGLRLSKPEESEKDWIENLKIKSILRSPCRKTVVFTQSSLLAAHSLCLPQKMC